MKIAIAGAGLIGRILAMRLYQTGFTDLTILERDDTVISTSPAMIAAGMLASFCESVVGGNLIYKLGQISCKLWGDYLTKLKAGHLLEYPGTLLLTQPQFAAEADHYIAKIKFNSGQSDFYQLLDKAQLGRLEPELKFNRGYLLPDEGMLDAQAVMQLLANYLHSRVNWRAKSEVMNISDQGTLIVNGCTENFDLIIDCRGLGALAQYPDLRGVRGEIIRLYAPEVKLSRPVRLFHPRHSIYIVPRANQEYVIGATEIEAADYSPVSVRSALELLGYAYSMHSGFAEARVIDMASNCRPALTDNLPRIKLGPCLIAINGLYRHGFLLAPALAETVVNYLVNGEQNYEFMEKLV